jgi:hypothetical protein
MQTTSGLRRSLRASVGTFEHVLHGQSARIREGVSPSQARATHVSNWPRLLSGYETTTASDTGV